VKPSELLSTRKQITTPRSRKRQEKKEEEEEKSAVEFIKKIWEGRPVRNDQKLRDKPIPLSCNERIVARRFGLCTHMGTKFGREIVSETNGASQDHHALLERKDTNNPTASNEGGDYGRRSSSGLTSYQREAGKTQRATKRRRSKNREKKIGWLERTRGQNLMQQHFREKERSKRRKEGTLERHKHTLNEVRSSNE